MPKKRGSIFQFSKKQPAFKPVSSRLISPDTLIGQRPLYSRQQKVVKNWKKIILLSLLFSSILIWLVLMIYHPFFQINDIKISGLKTINYQEINDYVKQKYLGKNFLPLNNYFLIRPGKVSADLSNKYAVEKVDVKKVFPGVLSIDVKEKITTIIYDNGSSFSLLDSAGTVIKIIKTYNNPATTDPLEVADVTTTVSTSLLNISSTGTQQASTTVINFDLQHKPDKSMIPIEYRELPIFYDNRRLSVYEKLEGILSQELIKFVINWQARLRSEGIGEIEYYVSENLSAGISVYTDKPWMIRVQPKNSFEEQIKNLKIILASREVKPSEYIDLRFGERVFWK